MKTKQDYSYLYGLQKSKVNYRDKVIDKLRREIFQKGVKHNSVIDFYDDSIKDLKKNVQELMKDSIYYNDRCKLVRAFLWISFITNIYFLIQYYV